MNAFKEKEFFDICTKLNAAPVTKDITLRYENSGFFNKLKSSIERDRRGEVVFCVVRPGGKIIIITCKEYPEGIYRIPTGGIGHSEDIIKAVFRETKEELGLEAEIIAFPGVLKIRFMHGDESFMFYSYLFILREVSGRLLLDASDDEISEVREVDVEGLEPVVGALDNIAGKWKDWGKFRYQTSSAILKYLRDKQI